MLDKVTAWTSRFENNVWQHFFSLISQRFKILIGIESRSWRKGIRFVRDNPGKFLKFWFFFHLTSVVFTSAFRIAIIDVIFTGILDFYDPRRIFLLLSIIFTNLSSPFILMKYFCVWRIVIDKFWAQS